MATTIGNIDLSRGQAPYNPMAGEYAIPANRTFTWESSPQEQSMLAAGMGRPDLSALMATGQYGPLAGQQYQYNNGRTTIGYGGSPWFSQGGFPGGGFPGGSYGPGGGYGNPWGDWTPPDWTPPDWTPPDWNPPGVSGTYVTPPSPDENPPFDPFGVDPEKVYYPPGSLVGQPDIFNDFTKFSLNEHKRIEDQKAWQEKLRNPISDINLKFGFEDAKANAARGIFPEKTYQDILNEKQAFMDAGGATASTNFTRGNDTSNIGQPGIAAQQAEAARIAAMRARARENAMGGGRPVPSLESLEPSRATSRLFGMDQAAQAQAEANARQATRLRELQPIDSSFLAQAQSRQDQVRQAQQAQRQAQANQARVLQEQAIGSRPGISQAGRSAREALEAGTRPRLPDPIDAADDSGSRGSPISYTNPTLRTPAGSPMGFSPSGIPSGSPNEAYARHQAAITQAREMQNLANQRRMEEARQRAEQQENALRTALGFGAPRPRASNQSISPFGGEPPRPVDRPAQQALPLSMRTPKIAKAKPGGRQPESTSNARQAAEANKRAQAKKQADRAKAAKAASVGQRQTASKGKAQAKARTAKANKAQATRGKPSENLALKAMKQAQARKKNIAAEKSLKKAMGSKNYAAYQARGRK